MKKLLFIILVLVAFAQQSYSQAQATVSGIVLDKQTNSPLPFTMVVIRTKLDSALVQGTITGEDGRFTLRNIPNGNYLVAVSFVGFELQQIPLLVGDLNNIFDLGKIELVFKTQQLDELVVMGESEMIAAGLDKKTFNLSENLSQSGGSVLDALRNLPGVTISPDGKVLLRGSDQVSVLIDSKQSSLTGFGNQKGLDNIPASNIEKIEIINNPSAKYNAAGMAGIVNIIYKKESEEGLRGEIGLAAGVGELWVREENLPRISPKYSFTPKLNPNLSLNYRSKKMNWFFQGDGIVRRRINANEFTTRDYTDGTADVASQFLENRTQKLYNIKGGLDWFLNDKNTFTLFALWQDEYHIDRGDVPYDDVETGQRLRLWTWAEDERTRFINYSANYQHKFSQPGHELKLGYLYTGGGEDEYFPFTDSSAVRVSDDATFLTVFEYVHSFTVDYVKPMRAGRLELGSRVNLRNIPITYTLTPGSNSILDPNLGQWSRYNEDVYAIYANVVRESTKLDVEAGLRFEPTWVKYELDPANIYYPNTAYEYFPLFPNVRLSYKINDKNTLSVFHNRRVDRPGEFEVRPFPKYDDPEILKTGNPNLRPQFTNTFEMAYKNYFTNGSLFFSVFYRQISSIFSRIYTQDPGATYAVINTIPANLGDGNGKGVEAVYQQSFSDTWKLTGSVTFYRNFINAFSGTSYYPVEQPFTSPATTINTGNFKFISSWKLPGKVDFQLSTVYYAPDIIPQGKVKSRFSMDFGIKKTSKNNKMEWRLAGTDLLNTFQIRKQITGAGFNLTANNYYETQVITFGWKYKF